MSCSSPVPDEEEDPWEDKTAEITFKGPALADEAKVGRLPLIRYRILKGIVSWNKKDVLTILRYSWELFNDPLADFKFWNFFPILNFKKNSVRRFVHSSVPVLIIDKYQYGDRFLPL
jgi:hypothetical protein